MCLPKMVKYDYKKLFVQKSFKFNLHTFFKNVLNICLVKCKQTHKFSF